MADSLRSLIALLPEVMCVDVQRLQARMQRLRPDNERALAQVAADVARSRARRDARVAAKPAVSYPPELPVSQRADEIAAAIRAHPVVIVCGETGSGKTTQLPKICLAAGRGERGLIGHTQPRRIAARAVAERIAYELATTLGAAVGYKVRFSDRTGPDAYIKLMTDGILLAETQGDRTLAAYDTIIVDEAHERSLNIDFLLGYLKQLLARRSDLKVVITSATLDAERFAQHFAHAGRPAPVIEVSGRLYPVDIRYRSSAGAGGTLAADEPDDEEELEEAIVATIEELWREGPGDILVFLPGEREIRETGDLARRALARRPYADAVELLPLYARLSAAEQRRIFAPSHGRRIVLSTNVAETSLTVPGIRYVIDSGLARIKRYSLRNKTTLLQIEKIAQSSAAQRAGRSGRVQDGVCVRLYDAEDFAARPLYTEPEILRSSLAAVILRAAALDLGPVDSFPFVEAPGPRAITDGYRTLEELGAVDNDRALTPLGRELARLPLDPRIGRILWAARDAGCLAEALVIASALAVPDPRERPLDKRAAADQAHLLFRDERSDFLQLVALWEFFVDLAKGGLSHRSQVEACRARFVSYLRLTEWRDVHAQLVAQLDDAGWKWTPALPKTFDKPRYEALHRALLAGLLSNIGTRAEEGDGYAGARGTQFVLHPSSGLAKSRPKWVLAAELTETSRLFARCAARIEPEWIEAVAGERVERSHFDPHWDGRRGDVVASERVQLFGLTLVARRPVAFGPIDANAAFEVFIREAMVPGELGIAAPFLEHNRKLIADIALLEHKARRADVLVDDETIAAFYRERVPATVHSRAGFEAWRSEAERSDPELLWMTRDALMRHAATGITEALYPESLAMAGAVLPLAYRHAPGHILDGLTLTVPLALLNQVDAARLSWLVPGMLREKVTTYFKALPKALRNRLMPIPDHVTNFLASEPSREVDLIDAVRSWLRREYQDAPDRAWFDAVGLPAHLRVNVAVVDAAGKELAAGRDLPALRQQLGDAAKMTFAEGGRAFERTGLKRWEVGTLPETLTLERAGAQVTGYPALVDEGVSVALTLLDTRAEADAATRQGVVRLVSLALKDALARYAKGPPGFAATALQFRGALAPDVLLADVLAAVADRAFVGDDALPRDEAAFTESVKRARARLPAVADGAFRLLAEIAAEHLALSQQLAGAGVALARLVVELKGQRDALVYPGFFSQTPWAQLKEIPRYLKALARRLAKYPERGARDGQHAARLTGLWQRYQERLAADRRGGRHDADLEAYRWLLEELRVSLFAQELKTPFPVSFKRLDKAWMALAHR